MKINKFFNTNSLFIKGSIGFIIKCFGAICSLGLSVLISHLFSVEEVGLYYLAVSVFALVSVLCKFGLENALIKYISIYNESNKGGTIKEILKKSLKLVLGISIISIFIIIIFAVFISTFIFKKPMLYIYLRIIIFSVLPNSVLAIYIACLKGIGEPQKAMFLESFLVPFINMVLLMVYYFVFKNSISSFLCISYLLSNIIVSLIGGKLIYKKISLLNDNNDETFEFKRVVNTALPLLMVASTNYILGSTDTLMLGMLSTEADVAIYNISSKITMLPSMILIAINTIIGPEFSIAYKKKNFNRIKYLLHSSSRLMIVLGACISSIFIFFSKYIILLFGSGFSDGRLIIMIVSVGQFFVLATGPTAALLMMTGCEKTHRNLTFISAVMNVILNYYLIPLYGCYGAAFGTSCSLILKNLLTVYYVYKEYKIFIYF